MKMRKLLATAVAASLAVTSMATVASAAEKTFDMGVSYGEIAVKSSGGLELGGDWCLTQEQIDAGATLGISANETIKLVVSDEYDTVNYQGIVLKVTGVKGKKGTSPKTYSYIFNEDVKNKEYSLVVYGGDQAPVDAFLPSQFVEITNVAIEMAGTHIEENKDMYYKLGDTEWGYWGSGTTISGGETGIAALINSISLWGANYDSKTLKNTYAFMAVTDDGDKTLYREEIEVLSYADRYYATNGGNAGTTDGDQTYDDDNMGTNPRQFAGLASQVADFFNKQTNGTITFKFTTNAGSGSNDWNNGGIPSTQVGLKNFPGDATANDFALFFNYDQTGSLQAITSVDTDAGTVTFDISDVLDELGGQTKGVIDNIYYGMTKGVKYDDQAVKGLYVESVTLAYDEDADVEADIEDDVEADDDVEIEEDDDVEIEDDADDAEEDDAEEDDAETDGDVIVETEDDDANPGTGVALAVVPAMVAAAAVVLSKKRK